MNVSFAVRFENIVNITNALVKGGKEPTKARDEAKFLEEEILKHSESTDEYQQLCEELVGGSKGAEPSALEPATNDEILNLEGPSYGDYQYATFHTDGQTSTIFKAKPTKMSVPALIVALKVMHPSQMQPPHNAQREARILLEAQHNHIVPLLQSFWQQDQFILVFPFLRQDLENLLRSGSLTTKQQGIVIRGLFEALAHIHSLNIIHRDVKPSNILLATMNGPVFLADFGIAWSAVDPQSEPANDKIPDVGTTAYRPPEVLFGDKAYDTALDMWAAGCVVAEMFRERHYPLFDAGPLGSELGLIKSIFTTLGTPNEKVWPTVSRLPDWGKVRFQEFPAKPWSEILPGAPRETTDFIQRTVCYEGSLRLTAAEALRHSFATKLQL